MSEVALYQLAGEYRQLAERLADMDLDATTVADTIEASGLTEAIQQKAQGVELVARAAEMHNGAIDAEIARLQALKARRQKIAEGLRQYVTLQMQAAGIEKIECPLFCLSLKKNPPAVEVLDEMQVPIGYWVTPEPKPPEKRIDKTAVKKAIQAGRDVPGCRLSQGVRLVVA